MNSTKLKGEIYFVLFRLIYIKATQKHLFMPVHFSDREMQRAWRNNLQAYTKSDNTSPNIRTNAHRLLLFYSIECGLKATFMKRQRVTGTEAVATQFKECGHDLNKLLDVLGADRNLKIPSRIIMQGKNGSQRVLDSGQINQMWRYGGEVTHTQNQQSSLPLSDKDLEEQLLEISKWIKEELQR